jgi:hypothetical protein
MEVLDHAQGLPKREKLTMARTMTELLISRTKKLRKKRVSFETTPSSKSPVNPNEMYAENDWAKAGRAQ